MWKYSIYPEVSEDTTDYNGGTIYRGYRPIVAIGEISSISVGTLVYLDTDGTVSPVGNSTWTTPVGIALGTHS